MTVSDEELLSDAETPPKGHNSLAELTGIVREHQDRKKKLADLEKRVKDIKAEITDLEQKRIPDTMLAIGVEKVTTSDGATVEVKPIVTGAIPKANREEATKWLRDHGFGDIIKRDLTVSFAVGTDDEAEKLCADLEAKGYAPVSNEQVHASTLKSWAKEQIEKGQELPLDLLGIYHGRQARITLPKTTR